MADRDRFLTIRATQEEREMLHDLAEKVGLSGSDILRQYIRRAHAQAFGASRPERLGEKVKGEGRRP